MSSPTTSNLQISNEIRGLQEDLGLPISAASTLMRLKKDVLVAKLTDLRSQMVTKVAAQKVTDEAEFQTALDDEGVDPEDLTDDELQDRIEEEGEDRGQDASVASTPTLASGTARRGAKPLQADDMVITVVVASNPKRDGSATAARFGLMRSGMTVAEYIAAVEKATGTSKRARRTLRKAVAAGQVVVSSPVVEG